MKIQVTEQQFSKLQDLYTYYNNALFSGELPNCMLNFSRKSKAMGFFVGTKWKDRIEGRYHEISINPDYIDGNVLEMHQTIVHEMCHLWQTEYGQVSRSSYHNKQWAEKMISVGLMPSSTGKPGGKVTGQNMNDYPLDNGLFMVHFKLIKTLGYKLDLPLIPVNYSPTLALLEEVEPDNISSLTSELIGVKKSKLKYSCACGYNVWGKLGLDIQCTSCDSLYVMEELYAME